MSTWRAIPGYEGYYEASSDGQVRSLPRLVSCGPPPGVRLSPGKVLDPWFDKHGYATVCVTLTRRRFTRYVHQLVAAAFHGPRPEGQQVRHLDGDPRNNAPANLAYGTGSENVLDSVLHGTHPESRKTHCPSGHPYDESNTYLRPRDQGRTSRVCRECMREHQRAYYHRARRAS